MEHSGFFNSSGNDRVYNAEDFAAYFGSLVSNGVFFADTNLKVTADSDMTLEVQSGTAWINGYNYRLDDTFEIAVPAASSANPRVDRIILRWSIAARAINLALLQGVPAANPTPPNLTRNANIYELGLAEILVPRNAAAILPENVTDTRLDQSVCGLVNSLVLAVYE